MKRRNELRQTWRQFCALWDAVAAPGPFGIDLDEEVAGTVVAMYDRLRREGASFCDAFRADMERLRAMLHAAESIEPDCARTPAERVMRRWLMAQGDDHADCEYHVPDMEEFECTVSTQLRGAGAADDETRKIRERLAAQAYWR